MSIFQRPADDLQEHALKECETMLNYALANGKKIPPAVLSKIKSLQKRREEDKKNNTKSNVIDDVGEVHGMLAATIAPASPSTVMLLEDTRKSPWAFLGPVPLVRRMMFVTLICLAGFLGLFISPDVDSISINGNILSYEPLPFILNELFLVSAAALGASFYALFEAYKYISSASYDPKYDSIYWIRFVLGVVSGIILAQFIFVGDIPKDTTNYGGMDIITYKPLLAFLGGFSARVVHKILNSLVDSVETFISGSARDAVRAREEAAKTEIQERINGIQNENNRKEAANRLAAVIQLMQLQEKIGQGVPNESIQNELKMIINQTIQPVNGKPFYTDIPHVDPNFNPHSTTTTTTTTNTNTSTNPNDIQIPDPTSFDIPEEFLGDLERNPDQPLK